MLVLMNHRELTTESKSTRLSIMRFCKAAISAVRECLQELLHLIALFQQYLVVFAKGDAEYDGCYVFEAVNPFFSFTSLTAYVKHAASCQPSSYKREHIDDRAYCMLNWPIVKRVS